MQATRSLSLRLPTIFGALICATAIGHAQFGEPVPAPRELAAAFDVDRATVQDLVVPARAGQDFRVQVRLGGQEYVLAMYPHDVRSPDYKLLVDDGTGVLTQVPTPPSVTYQGTVGGQPGSNVAASLIDGQLDAFIRLDGESWGIKPASNGMAGLPHSAHVVYRDADLSPEDLRCGVQDSHVVQPDGANASSEDGGGPNLLVCEIALDLDFEFYSRNGSSIVNAQNDATNIMNGVDTIYKNDTQISYTITTMVVRSGGNPNSYDNSNSSGALLSAFRSHWGSNHAGIQRDVAHLLTGKNNWSSTIGIASLGVICSQSSGFGLSHSKETSRRVGLTAHELGHNWSAGHCNGNPLGCRIMCSSLGGCGSPTFFATPSINSITSFANNRGCLTVTAQDPPTLTSVNLSTTTNYNGIPTNVTVTGVELDSVTSITVGSQTANITNQNPTSLTFQIQNGHEIGSHSVVATNNVGPSNPLPFSVTPTHPSVLVAPTLHQRGININYSTFTDAGWFSLYCLSALNGTTALPGIVTFEIGGGLLGQIIGVITVAADAGGRADLPVTMPTTLVPPFTLYWQCLTYDPAIPLAMQTPLETSNSAGVFTFF